MAVILDHVLSSLRIAWARAHGIQVGSGVVWQSGAYASRGFIAGRKGEMNVASGCTLAIGVVLNAHGGRLVLGRRVYVGPYSVLYGHGGLEIGAHTLIGPHCCLLSSNHTVPALDRLISFESDKLLPTRIEADVWLGAGVTVLGGVTIGAGCVVGAGAVVTHDLPPGAIAHGVPARIFAYRISTAPHS
jgi:acetyltransferase-like isoleucine patch superfamily enzyme